MPEKPTCNSCLKFAISLLHYYLIIIWLLFVRLNNFSSSNNYLGVMNFPCPIEKNIFLLHLLNWDAFQKPQLGVGLFNLCLCILYCHYFMTESDHMFGLRRRLHWLHHYGQLCLKEYTVMTTHMCKVLQHIGVRCRTKKLPSYYKLVRSLP